MVCDKLLCPFPKQMSSAFVSAAFVAPSVSCVSRGITAHRGFATAAPGPARQRGGVSPLSMAGDKADILDKVRGIVVSQLAVDEAQVVPNASFTQDLGADSLDTVELIMALEEGFDVSFEKAFLSGGVSSFFVPLLYARDSDLKSGERLNGYYCRSRLWSSKARSRVEATWRFCAESTGAWTAPVGSVHSPPRAHALG